MTTPKRWLSQHLPARLARAYLRSFADMAAGTAVSAATSSVLGALSTPKWLSFALPLIVGLIGRSATLSTRAGRVAGALASVACLIAGRRRASDVDTWLDHLRGAEEQDSRWRLLPIAFGFLTAAVRFRMQDLCAAAAKGLDWLTTTDERFGAMTVLSFVAPCVGCYAAGGWARVWDDMQSTGVVVGFVVGLMVWWRRYRGIEVRRSARKRPPG
jgi:hypothetical protein